MENILLHAVIVEENEISTDVVSIGSKVTITPAAGGKQMVLWVVGSQEADFPNGAISEDSPVGKALLGRRVGDRVTVETGPGTKYFMEIRAIEKGEDDDSLEISSY